MLLEKNGPFHWNSPVGLGDHLWALLCMLALDVFRAPGTPLNIFAFSYSVFLNQVVLGLKNIHDVLAFPAGRGTHLGLLCHFLHTILYFSIVDAADSSKDYAWRQNLNDPNQPALRLAGMQCCHRALVIYNLPWIEIFSAALAGHLPSVPHFLPGSSVTFSGQSQVIRKLVAFVPGAQSLWVLFAAIENQEAPEKNCRDVFSLSKDTGKRFCLY